MGMLSMCFHGGLRVRACSCVYFYFAFVTTAGMQYTLFRRTQFILR